MSGEASLQYIRWASSQDLTRHHNPVLVPQRVATPSAPTTAGSHPTPWRSGPILQCEPGLIDLGFHCDRLQAGVLTQGVVTMLATDPALLRAPERRGTVEVEVLVDPDVPLHAF